jgi:hypothetical protein
MKKRSIFLLCAWLTVNCFALPNAWINEIHYDNAGADVGEFVEVVVECPEEVCLWDLTLYMYNGADGKPYCLDCISEFTPGERVGPYQFYTWFRAGIQNDMEGMILVYFDSLVHIMAYEGSFYGTRDPATGLLFPDVGVCETGSSPLTASIYLTGFPGDPWAYGEASTPGSPNPGQDISDTPLPVRLSRFSAIPEDDCVLLEWQSESEVECAAYRIYRDHSFLSEIPAAGTSASVQRYAFRDKEVLTGRQYHYVLKERTYDGKENTLDSLRIQAGATKPFHIRSPFPNPLNPDGIITLEVSVPTDLRVDVLDLRGVRVMELHSGIVEAGTAEFRLSMRDYPSGRYFVRCKSVTHSECVSYVLLK